MRFFGGAAVAFGLLMCLASPALAQPPREDPGTPPPGGGGDEDGWMVVRIPGLPANAVLGDVWVDPAGNVYVWANYPTGAVVTLGEGETPVEGERLPGGDRGIRGRSSTLYKFNGTSWTTMLSRPGETNVLLYGTGPANIYASTNASNGETRLFRFNGSSWSTEQVPGYYLGRTHSMTGAPGDVYFRIDRVLLHDDGNGFQPVFEESGDHAIGRGMVYFGPQHLFMMCFDGHAVLENGVMTDMPAGAPFPVVEDAWGMRDAQGQLHLYALGAGANGNGVRLWRFNEENATTHAGVWRVVLADPLTGGDPGIGGGFHLWGAAPNDVYATGVVAGEGHAFRFDGAQWRQLALPGAYGTIHGVGGTNQGVVWFTTANGVLLRYQRPNRAPDLGAAVPSVDRLWPPDDRMVPVDIQGVVDPDGDPLMITITGVFQDEDAATAGRTTVCPDAIVNGSQVLLRAEHAEGGDGRTYQIQYTATDRLGASSRGYLTVCAPHYVTTPCDVDPALFDSQGPCGAPAASARPIEAIEVEGGMRIRYALTEAAQVRLGIYDLAGRCVTVLEDGLRSPGVYEARWNRGGAGPGIYFIKLRTGGATFTRRIVLLR